MPAYPTYRTVGMGRAAGFDIGVTASQVASLAKDVDAEIAIVRKDENAWARENPNPRDTSLAEDWAAFVRAWADELAAAQELDENILPRFGYGAAYDRIKDYRQQAIAWQKKIAATRGKPSSGPEITDPEKDNPLKPLAYAAGGAGLALLLLLLLKR